MAFNPHPGKELTMKTIALIEKGRDGSFGIFTPNIQHTIVGQGNTVSEAKEDFKNSVKEVLASYTDVGKTIPAELQDVEFEFRYDIASLFNYYKFINVTRFAQEAGINASLMRQYKSGNQYISENQVLKIEAALHKIAREFAEIRLV